MRWTNAHCIANLSAAVDQLALFPFRKPLLEQLGATFFKSVPKCPGVYLMRDPSARVLYVGQSKNLRVRLLYYKNVRPTREPRRLVRLVSNVTAIDIEVCPSAEHARVRELELLQEHRPKFNVSNNRPFAYCFIGLGARTDSLPLRLLPEPEAAEGEEVFGSFKTRARCRAALLALGRLFYCQAAPPDASVWNLPLRLSPASRTSEVRLKMDALPEGEKLVRDFLRGEKSAVVEALAEIPQRTNDPALRSILENDLLLLAEFFKSGPQLNRRISPGRGLIQRGELDLALFKSRQARVEADEMILIGPADAHPNSVD